MNQKIIAQKNKSTARQLYVSIVVLIAGAVFMVVMGILDKDDAGVYDEGFYIYFIGAAVFAAIAAVPVVAVIKYRNLPDILIWQEGEKLCFYNGYTCRAEDIRDVKSAFDSSRSGTLPSGKLTIYTLHGKLVCRHIKDLAFAASNVTAFKYGKTYSTEELKAAMARRAAGKGSF